MATITDIMEWLPQVLGISRSTLERLLRALRAARMLPLGKPGGGKGAAHYGALELAYIMLGLAGVLPSDAPDAVRALRSLPYRYRDPPSEDGGEPLLRLEDMLAYWIDKVGAARRAGGQWFPDAEEALRSWDMQLCLNPLHAIITIVTSKGLTTILYAAANPGDVISQPGVKRLTVVSGDVLLAVGELLADTEKQLASSTTSFLDKMPAKASPESKSAGHPCHRMPALSESQTHANGTGTVFADVLDVTCSPKGSQGNIPVAWAGSSLITMRSTQCPTMTESV